MNQSIEKTALSNLITNEDYARKVIPFLKGDYFKVKEEKLLLSVVLDDTKGVIVTTLYRMI